MYGQFLYFIVAIFIFASYPGAEKANFSIETTLTLLFFSWILFVFLTHAKFRKIEKETAHHPLSVLDQKHDAAVSRQTIAALLFFAADIFILNLPDFLNKIYLVLKIPTLSAVACLGLFICHMAVVWIYSHNIRQKFYTRHLSVFSTIRSNLLLAATVVLPWLMLSFIFDILRLLPDNRFNAFLSSAPGEVVCFIFFLFIILTIGPFFIQKLWQCKPLEPGDLRDRIIRLCKTAGMPFKDILVWPIYEGRMITAGVMGLIKNFRYILITPSLIQLLNTREIDAVVAHEIGHIKKRHLLLYGLFFLGFMAISLLLFRFFFLIAIWLYNASDTIRYFAPHPSAMTSMTLNVMFIVSFILYFRFIFGFFIRNFERQADAYVYQLFDSAYPLITTLDKIARAGNLPPEKPNWHHFSIKERILFLLECEKDKTRILRHDRKVKKSVVLYLIMLAAMVGIASGLAFSKAGKDLTVGVYEKTILEMIKQSPEDPLLYGDLGDLYQAAGQYEKAAAAYGASLRLYPENPVILNNLAWLLATCPDPEIKNPHRALETALKASQLEASSYILDTLAECYYITGDYEKALETGLRAKKLSKENDRYYRSQIKKFEDARTNKTAR